MRQSGSECFLSSAARHVAEAETTLAGECMNHDNRQLAGRKVTLALLPLTWAIRQQNVCAGFQRRLLPAGNWMLEHSDAVMKELLERLLGG